MSDKNRKLFCAKADFHDMTQLLRYLGNEVADSQANCPVMSEPLSPTCQTFAARLFEFRAAVAEKVRRRRSTFDDDLFNDAFLKAILEIADKPEKYDSNRGTWVDFLVGATLRVLSSEFRSQEARRRREQKKGESLVAEQRSAARNPLEELLEGEECQLKTARAQMIRDELARTEEERRVLYLWERGIDDLAEWARALNIGHLPEKDQEEQATRMRKRLIKRMERIRDRLAGEETAP